MTVRRAPPYLSIVVTSRNDDHGGGLLRRMSVFVHALVEQCRRHKLDAELILVEWNPPEDRPRLSAALEWPADSGSCAIRIIEVPPSYHRRLRHSDALPLFQMIAKNVGIRRARGAFVLATNVDVILPDEIVRLMASRTLDPTRMYRLDRHDVPSDVPWPAPMDELLGWCASHVERVNRREGTFRVDDGLAPRTRPVPLWRRAWRAGRHVLSAVAPTTGSAVPSLHINACGDFTLLSRERWHALRGYPELEMFSFHLDSLLCFAAHAQGAAELFLDEPYRIYHVEHARGWSPEGEADMFARLRARGIPWLEHSAMTEMAAQICAGRAEAAFNGADWGFGQADLSETEPGRPPSS